MELTDDELRTARRERHEQRRALQRTQNVVRAKNMHAARLLYENSARTAPNAHVVASPRRGSGAQHYVGCSGWY